MSWELGHSSFTDLVCDRQKILLVEFCGFSQGNMQYYAPRQALRRVSGPRLCPHSVSQCILNCFHGNKLQSTRTPWVQPVKNEFWAMIFGGGLPLITCCPHNHVPIFVEPLTTSTRRYRAFSNAKYIISACFSSLLAGLQRVLGKDFDWAVCWQGPPGARAMNEDTWCMK